MPGVTHGQMLQPIGTSRHTLLDRTTEQQAGMRLCMPSHPMRVSETRGTHHSMRLERNKKSMAGLCLFTLSSHEFTCIFLCLLRLFGFALTLPCRVAGRQGDPLLLTRQQTLNIISTRFRARSINAIMLGHSTKAHSRRLAISLFLARCICI